MQEFTGSVSVLHDLQTIPPLHYDLGVCPDLVKMNVKSATLMYPLDFCRPYSYCIRCAVVSCRT